jgi:membrane-associated phospholipid phosphatase
MSLPAVRTVRGLAAAAAATVLVCAAMYFVPQHWWLAEPVQLPLTALDRAIPYWPTSGLVYFAVFPLLLMAFLGQGDPEAATRFLYACLLAQVVGMTCFLLWPTVYPRAVFPVPPGTGRLGAVLARLCRSTDLPVNCLPSLHVSTVTLCVCSLRGSRWFAPALLAGIPIALSTLTFKQHYVADVMAGFALGLASWWLCFRWSGLRLAR